MRSYHQFCQAVEIIEGYNKIREQMQQPFRAKNQADSFWTQGNDTRLL